MKLAGAELLCHAKSMKTNFRILKAIRIANDMSQREMAKLAGVSERSVATMETGGDTTLKTTRAVQEAFERQGVTFLPELPGKGFGVVMPEGWVGPESLLPKDDGSEKN